MNAFKTHFQVISEYKEYLDSFVNIHDERIVKYVEESTMKKDLLPDPLVQFNPSYEKREAFEDLVAEGILHRDVLHAVNLFPPFRHQIEAIKLGVSGKGFVVTSGTGSGKSLTYLTTIFDALLKKGKDKKKGIKAILVYPMNALINSQFEEISKYEKTYEERTGQSFPISFAKYTGQEGTEEREKAQKNKPDIILTNYMMLELLMTRRNEKWFRKSISKNLEFLVYDELHTYRGRQGSDVSLLNRRIQALAEKELIFIGTSATMASKGTPEQKKKAVAEVAEIIFGKKYELNQIVNEYLVPSLDKDVPTETELKKAIEQGIDIAGDEDAFKKHPLAKWIEMNVALKYNENVLERGIPLSIPQIVQRLNKSVSLEDEVLAENITNLLKWAERINANNRERGIFRTFLPFRLHQFISQTGSISVTLDSREKRIIRSSEEPTIKIDGKDVNLFPVLFSRYSGVDFLKVELDLKQNKILPVWNDQEFENEDKKSNDKDLDQEDFKYGYVILDEGEEFWKADFTEFLPESWSKKNGLKPFFEMVLPRRIYFNKKGDFSFRKEEQYNLKGYYLPTPLRIDPTAYIVYEDSRMKDSTKLSRLGSEGRSTATSVLSYAIVNSLIDQKELYKDQKLLSFTDNRQDASLQAGHFNDFYTTVRFRSALYNALERKNLEVHEIDEELLRALNLKEIDYARDPSEDPGFPDRRNTEAIKKLLLYYALSDLKRGWRYTMPNLEQVGLLEIEYFDLERLASYNDRFAQIEMLDKMEVKERYSLLKTILDYFRTNSALDHRFYDEREKNENLIKNRLREDSPWALGTDEEIERPKVMTIQSIPKRIRRISYASMGSRSNLGKYLQRIRNNNGFDPLKKEEYEQWLKSILEILRKANFIVEAKDKRLPENDLYKLRVDNLIWKRNTSGGLKLDRARFNSYNEMFEIQPNNYFMKLYQKNFKHYEKELVAREHTGQIGSEQRIRREDDFRKGNISTMYCSPTMELGIDISNLNIVHMRNVPPNPANYAQRSGRAGRSGQTALVFTYCANRSPHDVHYFKNAAQMVSGIVQPPRIDLKNEELLLTHLNSFLLMELEIDELKNSAADVLDLSNEKDVKVREDIMAGIEDQIKKHKAKFKRDFEKVLEAIYPEIQDTHWFTDNWVLNKIQEFPTKFKNVFRRWILMFQNACVSRDKAQQILDSHQYKKDSKEKKRAERQESFARKQIDNLKNQTGKNQSLSEFYIFRYLAAEGFLPGYNFTRLPVRAVLGKGYKDNVEVISRPRALALNEFGPNNIIYHSGSKFRIHRMMITDIDAAKEKILISTDTGYAFMNEEADSANVDPITGVLLKGSKQKRLGNLLELSECEGFPIQKITSIEEERSRLGFEIHSYFNYPQGIENAKSVILEKDGMKLLQLYFNSATQLVQLNLKSKRTIEDGFNINPDNGAWLRASDLKDDEELQEKKENVFLYTKDTADTLYIQPLGNIGTTPEQVLSLSYALKRGIERLFLVEENEIGVSVMGNPEKPNILIYEAAEGSLGILSQLMDPIKMKEWFEESYAAIHFNPETFEETENGKTLPKATYEDLLSYYNQMYHKDLDRYAIKETLEYLIKCEINGSYGSGHNRETQYQKLLEDYDRNSEMELKFIQYLFKNNYVLPDIAQYNIPNYYISADFVYKNNGFPVIIFCDGSVHDNYMIKEDDAVKRQILKDAGYDVIEWYYKEPLEVLVERRKDVFRKIK